MKLEQLVAFCVLMEGHGGIVTKAPSYIMEKYESCEMRESREDLLELMDRENADKFRKYIDTWRIG